MISIWRIAITRRKFEDHAYYNFNRGGRYCYSIFIMSVDYIPTLNTSLHFFTNIFITFKNKDFVFVINQTVDQQYQSKV